MSTQRVRRQSLTMVFNPKVEAIPTAGETRIMRGSYGTTYAVTIHKIKSRTDGEKYVYLDVIATRRVVAQDGEE